MRWKLLKGKGKGKERSPERETAAEAVRSTGVEIGLPRSARVTLGVGALAVAVAAVYGGGKVLFDQYYNKSQGLFTLTDVRRNVTVETGTTLLPDTVYDMLKLKDGMNQFDLRIAETREALMAREPNIKDLTVVRRLPDRMTVSITERTPIARLGSGMDGRVVDDDGVMFLRYVGTGALPIIKGAEVQAQITEGGGRLHGLSMAAVRLINDVRRPEVSVQLLELEVRQDYLQLVMSGHRQASFAWDGMEDEEKNTKAKMQGHLEQLAMFMDSEIGRSCLKWDARVPGRITAVVPGLQ